MTQRAWHILSRNEQLSDLHCSCQPFLNLLHFVKFLNAPTLKLPLNLRNNYVFYEISNITL